MPLRKKILFALLPVLLLMALVEGTAPFVWSRLEQEVVAHGEQHLLENNPDARSINFFITPHPDYQYVLRPGFALGGTVINAHGFCQRDEVPEARSAGKRRVVAVGESSTQGHDVDTGNYPIYLKRLLTAHCPPAEVEMLNPGVAGWLSDRSHAGRARACRLSAGRRHPVHRLERLPVVRSARPASFRVRVSIGLRRPPRTPSTPGSSRWPWRRPCTRSIAGSGPCVLEHSDDRCRPRTNVSLLPAKPRSHRESEADYQPLKTGRIGWMKDHQLSHVEAAEDLHRFNALLREYAANHQLVLIDTAATFADLDRSLLQYDFCHMKDEGYELLAEVMYEGLRQSHVVAGTPSAPRGTARQVPFAGPHGHGGGPVNYGPTDGAPPVQSSGTKTGGG